MSPNAKQNIPIQMSDHERFTSPLKNNDTPNIAGTKIIESKTGYAVAKTFSNNEIFDSGEYAMYMLGIDIAMEIKIAPVNIFFVIAFFTGFR